MPGFKTQDDAYFKLYNDCFHLRLCNSNKCITVAALSFMLLATLETLSKCWLKNKKIGLVKTAQQLVFSSGHWFKN